jgi:hypothetical protein
VDVEQIRKQIANGFKPFEVRLADGRRIPVSHPEFLAVGERVVVVSGDDDQTTTIDPLDIVSIEEKHGKP